jgi:hypothetical protein
VCYMLRPLHPRFDHRDNIWWSLQVMKLLIMQPSPASHHFLLHRFNKSLCTKLKVGVVVVVVVETRSKSTWNCPYQTRTKF